MWSSKAIWCDVIFAVFLMFRTTGISGASRNFQTWKGINKGGCQLVIQPIFPKHG